MAWQQTEPIMNQKIQFAFRAKSSANFSELCHLTPSLPAMSGLAPQPFRLSKTPPDPRRFSPAFSGRLKAGRQNAKARAERFAASTMNHRR